VFKLLGVVVAGYTLWSAFEGRVYAKAGGLRAGRRIVRDSEPRYFWAVIAIYGGLSVALMTVF
jgi:hypothetical protein